MKLKPGQSARHPKYGWGTILECDDVQTVVCFSTVGIKKFSTSSTSFVAVEDRGPKKKTSPC